MWYEFEWVFYCYIYMRVQKVTYNTYLWDEFSLQVPKITMDKWMKPNHKITEIQK